jgi:hypothetical protein
VLFHPREGEERHRSEASFTIIPRLALPIRGGSSGVFDDYLAFAPQSYLSIRNFRGALLTASRKGFDEPFALLAPGPWAIARRKPLHPR